MSKMRDFQFDTDLLDHGFSHSDVRRGVAIPHDGLKENGSYFAAYLQGESGRRYHGLREFDGTAVGQSHVLSFASLRDGDMTKWADELWDSPRAHQIDPYTYEESDRRVVFETKDATIEVTDGGFKWTDAGGNWDLEMTVLGDKGYYFWIPVQDDIPICQYQNGFYFEAVGTVDGDKVKGSGYFERAWGPAESTAQFWDFPLIRRMNKLYMTWYARFEGGGTSIGVARKGRIGVNWSMAYVVNDGVAKVITPTMTDIAYTKAGVVERARLNTGEEVFEFEQDCTSYYPIHTMGKVAEVTGRPAVESSFTNLEWWPDNSDVVIKYAFDHRNDDPAKGLLGQLADFPIVGEHMVLPTQ